LLTAEGAS